ncbi:MAG TPA: beta-N-acetylhexosaminidase [Verrucomicrobiae bacterium]|nr:beta-N-acetylhexosaminidase [Verrucomicrobiae bacterium]
MTSKVSRSIVGLAGLGLASLLAVELFAGTSKTPALVPLPQKLEMRKGTFVLRPKTRIVVDAASRDTGDYLAQRLRHSTGFALPVVSDAKTKGDIVLGVAPQRAGLGEESYDLSVSPGSVVIEGGDSAGVFYGAQTLLQLVPVEVFSSTMTKGIKWSMPSVAIHDQPRFAWRGFMLDVSRHFFNKSEIKQMLDLMALHKLNTFHWHLTDDQGWRIEIKKYPRLTEVGAWRKSIGFKLDPKASRAYGPDGRYGGYYTQDDIREIVAYAKALHITIVPEIEMPGHSSAALAAYPELSCTGGPFSTDMSGGVFPGVYCAGNDETFNFLENVLSEVMELFPGKYIHIGGDEVPKQSWMNCEKCQARMKAEGLKTGRELESYFVRRIEKFLNSRGRRLIGWSEIREGGLAQNAAVMDWIGGAFEAASAGHDVVMTPTAYCYFDHYQSTNHATEPHAIGGFLPLNQVYAFDPIPADLEAQYRSHIIGAQANLWTEYVPSFKHVQYMAFPRLCAMAEVGWSPQQERNYDDFRRRLAVHCRRLDDLGVNYRKGIPDANAPKTIQLSGG